MSQTRALPVDGHRTVAIDECFDFAERQVKDLVTRMPGRFPTYTDHGRWVFEDDPWAPAWSGGFLAGMMWIFAARSADSWWRDQAERYSRLLEPRRSDPSTHDLGFLLEPSWGRWYDLTQAEEAKAVLIDGGRAMARRLQPGGYLSTWVDPGSTFIDIMMNVGIIFRAAQYSEDPALFEAALRHCRTSRRFLIRGDGSTVHEGWFDPQSGEFLRAATHQGWRSDSTWARGQAWAIYGFATAYRYTKDNEMLDAACRSADYFISQTPMHTVPPYDWVDPHPFLPWETSAAAVAAAGFLHLATAIDEPRLNGRYWAYGVGMLETLRSTEFVAADVPAWQGVLRHAIYHHRNGIGVDESVMWGDYYFIEALDAACRRSALAEMPSP